jgi:energy-coupling factor transport system substrate-specific component
MKKLTLKDITFAAIIAAVMIVVSLVVVPLVVAVPVPGIRNLVVAPFFGLFISLAIVRINHFSTITLVSFLTGAVQLFIGPVILVFLVTSGIIADILRHLFWRDTTKNSNVIISTGVYMAVMAPLGAFFGVLMSRETPIAEVLSAPWFMVLAAVLSGLLGVLGAFLGMKIAGEFKNVFLTR